MLINKYQFSKENSCNCEKTYSIYAPIRTLFNGRIVPRVFSLQCVSFRKPTHPVGISVGNLSKALLTVERFLDMDPGLNVLKQDFLAS